jgi:MoxR-like ATPase
MNIQEIDTHYLLDPAAVKNFTQIITDKYVLVNKEANTFDIMDLSENLLQHDWIANNVDGKKLRTLKRNLIQTFGDMRLEEYKYTDRIHQTLSKLFVNTSAVSDVLRNGLANDMNTILFGAGGFGKSEMCSALFGCPELKDRVFIKSFSEATTEEDLFGGINIKKMTDTGVIEYNCENSFANKEIVIFEEVFDANPRVLAALKDTLTAKEIRNGNQRFPIKTKIIIGLTNKTYDEVIEDASTEALTQRFPVAFKLEYPLTKLDIASLVLNRYSSFDQNKLAAIVESASSMKGLTPRKVLEMAKYIKDLTIRKNKKYTESITNNHIIPVIDYLRGKTSINCRQIIVDELIVTKRKIETEDIYDYDTLLDLIHNIDIISNTYKDDVFTAFKAELIAVINNKLSITA